MIIKSISLFASDGRGVVDDRASERAGGGANERER